MTSNTQIPVNLMHITGAGVVVIPLAGVGTVSKTLHCLSVYSDNRRGRSVEGKLEQQEVDFHCAPGLHYTEKIAIPPLLAMCSQVITTARQYDPTSLGEGKNQLEGKKQSRSGRRKRQCHSLHNKIKCNSKADYHLVHVAHSPKNPRLGLQGNRLKWERAWAE
jgi:hypothetical protein